MLIEFLSDTVRSVTSLYKGLGHPVEMSIHPSYKKEEKKQLIASKKSDCVLGAKIAALNGGHPISDDAFPVIYIWHPTRLYTYYREWERAPFKEKY